MFLLNSVWRYCISIIIFLFTFISIRSIHAQVKVIFDTDIGPDWDDVGAAATLHGLTNKGEAEILGMMVSSGGHSATWGPPCLDAFNTYYGRPDIPIGVAQDGPSFGSSYNQQIAEEFPQDLGTTNAWDAVELYRKILSEQPDSSVVIITTGFTTNIEDLLKSESDSYSELNGIDLVVKKVKRWVSMGGGYPSSGGEFNFNQDATATIYAVENWPKPVLFSGFEIGVSIYTGAKLALTSESNPVRRAYELAGGYVGSTHNSWDQTAVLAAIRDPLLYWDLETTGYCHVFANGSNEWRSSPDKDHSYLISRVSDSELVEILDNLMADLEGIPEVSITSPANGTSFDEGSAITIEASALDTNGQVIKVEFFAQTVKIGEDMTEPYSMVWNDVPAGGYYLTAKVTDDEGLTRLSDPVKIYVGDINNNLVGHWMFENNVMDSSDHGNNGSITGNPQYVPGIMNTTALEFDGEQDYVSIPESPDFSMTSFTLAAWVKIPDPIPSGWRTIIEHDRSGDNWFGLWKSNNGHMFHFRWSNVAVSDFSSIISPDVWYHVAGTYDLITKTAHLYLNGELDRTVQNENVPKASNSELRIGINMQNNEDFVGIIDDVRVYNRVLDESEINQLFIVSSIEMLDNNDNDRVPETYNLNNYPNPFNPSTIIHYELPITNYVELSIYNLNGQKVASLISETQSAGKYTVQWDASGFASGIYYYELRTSDYCAVKKMALMK
jgi:hypothetical protein